MSSRRRRVNKNKKYIDGSIFSDGIYISKEYKDKLIILGVAIMLGSFIKGVIVGFFAARLYDKN